MGRAAVHVDGGEKVESAGGLSVVTVAALVGATLACG